MKFIKNFFLLIIAAFCVLFEKLTFYKLSFNLDIQSILNNMAAYPLPGDNAVRKTNPIFDTQTVATGTTKYQFFNTDTGDLSLRNIQFPLSGSTIFFVTGIRMLVQTAINTAALVTTLTNLLQHSYLEIIISGKKTYKIPGLAFINVFDKRQIGNSTPQNYATQLINNIRRFYFPIIINSTADIEVNFYIPSAAATSLNGTSLKLYFEGIQTDKLDSFSVDFVKNYNWQKLDFDAYETQSIDTSADNYQLFVSNSLGDSNQSLRFPLSNIRRFQLNALQLLITGADADTEFLDLLYWDKAKMYLEIMVDQRLYFQSTIEPFLSILAQRDSTFTDGTTTTDYFNLDMVLKKLVLKQPVVFPAQGNVQITLYQPTTTLANGQPFTVNMQGIITQRLT